MKSDFPENEKEFNKLMIEIDNSLKEKNIPIFSRSIHSMREIAMKFKISITFGAKQGEANLGVYNEDNLSEHINNWYQSKYGNRLKVQMGVGTGVLLIRNDPWRIIYPLIFGTVSFVCDTNLDKYKDAPSITSDGTIPVLNILNLIEDMSTDYAKLLSESDLKIIVHHFISGLDSLSSLNGIKSKPFIKEARIDLENAVNNILSKQAHYGQSKWASLQFAEKLIKCFLKEKSVEFPKNHKLSELYNLAVNSGLPSFSTDLLMHVQCSASVRYGEEIISLEEAVNAHYSSLGICYFMAKEIV